ncbi:MAG TPA: hypothetical protein VFL57_16840, partial [Bryobacteraceae bacterium]|nr:hypothetical protein [Bryobacteraceae bacterium]
IGIGRVSAMLNRFTQDTGLDPRKDLWELLFVGNGKDTFVMCRGEFAPRGLEPRLEKAGARRFGHKGYTFLGDDRFAVTFMNSSTAVAGPTPLLRAIIDNRNRGGSVPATLQARLKEIPPGSHVWAVGDLAAATGFAAPRSHQAGGPAAGNLLQFTRLVENAAGGVDFSSGMKLHGTANCRNEQDASRLNSAVRAVVGLGRLNTPSDEPDLLRAFDAIRSQQNGTTVKMDAELTQPQFEGLLDFVQRRGRG